MIVWININIYTYYTNTLYQKYKKQLFFIKDYELLRYKFFNYIQESKNYYTLVETIANRLNDKIIKVSTLKKQWERIGIDNYMPYPEDNYDNVYCSKKLYEISNSEYVIKDTWIDIFATQSDLLNKGNLEDYSKIINDNGYICIASKDSNYLRPFAFNDKIISFYKQDRIYLLKNTNFLIVNLWKLIVYFIFNIL